MSVSVLTKQGGLFVAGSSERVPLVGVRVEARILGHASRVTMMQCFRNTEDRPIEAVYVCRACRRRARRVATPLSEKAEQWLAAAFARRPAGARAEFEAVIRALLPSSQGGPSGPA